VHVILEPPDWAHALQSDLTDWQRAPVPVARLEPITLPDDAFFEYAWVDADGERRPDPANPNPRLNPWWDFASNLQGPDYRPDAVAAAATGRPRGRVLRLEVDSKLLGETRRALIYSPAGSAEAALPVVLFQDGKAYYGWGRAPQVLDRLLAGGEVAPAHLVFLPPRQRTREYAFNDLYRRFILEELLPQVERRARCDGRRVAWGASLGGLLSAQLAWERPDLFQKVVTQSGAYLFSADMDLTDPFAGNETFLQQVRSESSRAVAWHLDCGTLEWLLESNRRVCSALAQRGHEARLLERNVGHNWTNWRNGLAAGFRFALDD